MNDAQELAMQNTIDRLRFRIDQMESASPDGHDSTMVHPDDKLLIDVTIGNGTFRKGVPVSLVLQRLKRQEKYEAGDSNE